MQQHMHTHTREVLHFFVEGELCVFPLHFFNELLVQQQQSYFFAAMQRKCEGHKLERDFLRGTRNSCRRLVMASIHSRSISIGFWCETTLAASPFKNAMSIVRRRTLYKAAALLYAAIKFLNLDGKKCSNVRWSTHSCSCAAACFTHYFDLDLIFSVFCH